MAHISRRSSSRGRSTPAAPPLPAAQPRLPLQRARDAASRLFFSASSRPPSPQGNSDPERFSHGGRPFMRSASLGETQNATASHKTTGVTIRTISINESGTHAIIAGKDIFKTVLIEDGRCVDAQDLRGDIRRTATHASGQVRQVYQIDIADVAWAKGDTGNLVAAATSSGKIIVYDIGHAQLQAAQLHEHFRQVHNVTFSPHRGSLLLSGSQDGTVRLWDVRDFNSPAGKVHSKRKYSGQSDGVRDVKWSPTEGYDFAFATDTGEIQRWDMRNLKGPKVRVPAHSLSCNTVDWHPDGKHIVSAGSDKTIRVFDVSGTRPRKASWEIKTAHPVMIARWRPSCRSMLPQDNGAGFCTQVVAAYDKHPFLQIWDFRRPSLPFRELKPHDSSPADLLWHSQDLLWTVGSEGCGSKKQGVLLQTDIQHTQKVVDRCNLQAIDVSPLGELTFVAQTRKHARVPPKSNPPHPSPPSKLSSLGANPDPRYLSRSLGDDGLDHSFLSALPIKRPARSDSHSGDPTASRTASSSNQTLSATIKLDDILCNRQSFRPQQVAVRGHLPARNHNNQKKSVAFLAAHSRAEVAAAAPSADDDFLQSVQDAFTANHDYAASIGFLRTAQMWKIVSFCAINHLKKRFARRRQRAAQKSPPTAGAEMRASIEHLARNLAMQHLKSPLHSPASPRPKSIMAKQLALPESTSNVPTPLARPTTNGTLAGSQHLTFLPDPDAEESVVLPPSLTSLQPPPQRPTPWDRRLTIGNLSDLQQNQAYRESSERSEMVEKWSAQAKNVLNLDPVDPNGVKIPLAKLESHGSGESFQFLEDSAGSRGPSFPSSFASTKSCNMPMVAAHPTRRRLPRLRIFDSTTSANDREQDLSLPAQEPMFFEGSDSLGNSAVATQQNSGATSKKTSTEDLQDTGTDTTDFAVREQLDNVVLMERSASLHAREVFKQGRDDGGQRDSSVFDRPSFLSRPPHHESQHKVSHLAAETILSSASPTEGELGETDIDLEENAIWTLIEMLEQLVDFYTDAQPYPQMASLLLLLLGPLLPCTHPLPIPVIHQTLDSYVDYFMSSLGWAPEDVPRLIKESFEQPIQAGLQPLQVESILSTYHEQLLRYQLFDEAAVLRTLAYPAYPAVYEDFLKDNRVRLQCSRCGKRLPSGPNSLRRCEKCKQQQPQKQEVCPICWTLPGVAQGSPLLRTSCLRCGHSAHAACLNDWFAIHHGDSCPTPGCLCDCVAGAWREERMALAERKTRPSGHGRVRSDEWKARESQTVVEVRSELKK